MSWKFNRLARFLSDQHADESIGRSDHPATAGRHCRSGARQSMPSISIDNCAEVSISVPPGSTFNGHKKTPCSSRLYLI
jgi:hypothetical protein